MRAHPTKGPSPARLRPRVRARFDAVREPKNGILGGGFRERGPGQKAGLYLKI